MQGLGLLGLYACAIAKARGARLVIGLDPVAQRLKTARKFGADLTFDIARASAKDVTKAVREACRPDGADAVIEQYLGWETQSYPHAELITPFGIALS